jgi:hypothetical protein
MAVAAHGTYATPAACTYERLMAWCAFTLTECRMHAAMSESLAPLPSPKTLQLQRSSRGDRHHSNECACLARHASGHACRCNAHGVRTTADAALCMISRPCAESLFVTDSGFHQAKKRSDCAVMNACAEQHGCVSMTGDIRLDTFRTS